MFDPPTWVTHRWRRGGRAARAFLYELGEGSVHQEEVRTAFHRGENDLLGKVHSVFGEPKS